MAKKKKEIEEEASSYNWMDTYGDLVTNLLCFFVLLYAFSSVDDAKWKALVEAFSDQPTTPAAPVFDISFARESAINKIDPMVNIESREEMMESGQSTDDKDKEYLNVEDIKNMVEDSFDKLYMDILMFIDENDLQDNMSVERTEDVIIIRFGEVFLFQSGQATLIDNGGEFLRKITVLIENNVEAIEEISIEGHTDNIPIFSERYRSNWELSTARASSVLQKVLEFNILEPKMLTAKGCGEYWPVDTNETIEGRARNRRVDIVIEKLDVND